MAVPHRSVAALRIFGDALNPDEISRILGCSPTESFVKGQITYYKRPDILRKSGGWILDATERTPGDFDAQMEELFGKVNSDLAVWTSLSNQYRMDLFCGLFMEETNEGIELSVKTMKMLSERGIKFGVCIYASITDPIPSDACPCGSGKTYGECCAPKLGEVKGETSEG
jgi:hypothetical protein